MLSGQYSFRSGITTNERTYSLSQEDLHWKEGNNEGNLAYADIEIIRLDRFLNLGSDFKKCVITDQSGNKMTLKSTHFKGLGSFEDRSPLYRPFVEELIYRTAKNNPNCSFLAGSTTLYFVYLFCIIFCVIVLALLGLAIVVGTGLSGSIFVYLIVMAMFLPAGWRIVRRGREKTFDPDSPPVEMLGGEKAALQTS